MKTEALERYLNSFGKYIVQQSRTNLTKGKKNVSKDLYNSISFKVITTADGFSVQFFMDSYGTFVDKGVSGTDVRRSFKDYKGKTISSPYKYTTKQPPSRVLDKWIVKKGIAPRDEKGRFMSRKSISFLIARSIKRKGIQGISFFQRPLQLGLENFGKEMLGALKEDIINGLTTVK
jgi:hypothetical protein